MSLFVVKDLMFNYGDKELFNHASFQLNANEHAVLVGKNGAGKTTLLDLLSKKLTPDAGVIEWTNKVTYSYLDQHYAANKDESIKEYLENIYQDLFNKEKLMNELFLKGSDATNPDYMKCLNQASAINDELIRKDFYQIKEKIDKIITGLGIDKELINQKLNRLSTGQREKIYLAKMLLEEHDVLLLDEPTNYLDSYHVKWLTNYLIDYPKAFLVVSHDETFLKQIANVVFLLANKVIDRYKGDYSYFLKESVLRKEQYEKNYLAQERYIKKEEEFIAAHIVRATSSKAAKSRRKRLSHLERLDKPINDNNMVFFNFPYSGDVGEEILSVNKLVIGYAKPLLAPITFNIKKGEKIAIIGKNGVGKTTLIKTIMGLIPSLDGKYTFNEKIKINYFSQDELADLSITPVQYLTDHYPNLTPLEARTILARSGIKKELALHPLSELSGGEEAKTRLAVLTLNKSNILILDEPTNHLDVIAKEALKNAIMHYPGPLIIVSHEKDFYEDVADYIISFN